MPKTLEKPMTFDQVKDFLGCSSTFLYGELQGGRLAGFKLGIEWRVYPSELQKYMDRQPNNRKRLKIAR